MLIRWRHLFFCSKGWTRKHHSVFGLSAGYSQTQRMGSERQASHGGHQTSNIALATTRVSFEPEGRGENAFISVLDLQPMLGPAMCQQSTFFVAQEAMSNMIL